ncbi:DUF2076 domain-containing protein [Chelatococcus sambhunathii]|uniref:DUF2076 domain-containing protein n=1 Tax=Chelatococcus sambhunathii TaxID=363953 RepID=A0ABU1DK37_9HYPH|nr:DUF2076 domain-containing protein [Chelatococcus sambhunathii]MDR4308489.1 DUF2076 domain-containing protein [Chelatococcus sambhunathii]
MNEAERDLIAGLFQRIRSVETARRDPEAENFISEQVARQPHAPYAMAQTIVVQERALEEARQRVQQLERELTELRAGAERIEPEEAPEPPRPSPWGPRAQETMARAEESRGGYGQTGGYGQGERLSPPFGAPQTGYGQSSYGQPGGYGAPQQPYPPAQEPSRGGGFLSGALQTAAGVAAGALVFQGVRSMFGGGEEGHAGAGDAARLDSAGAAGGGESGTQQIGDWYSGLFGGGDGRQADAGGGEDDDGGLFDPGDDDGDWV